MNNTINGRTPEEIKKWLECCAPFGANCGDCPYEGECMLPFGDDPESDALAYIQQLEAAAPKWISVEERLPGMKDVIAINTSGEMLIGLVSPMSFGGLYKCDSQGDVIFDVTHWMPLPEPPTDR